ncbi:MAG: NfeD family protein [Leptospiraceae bacterium]|nr:NfeD family protein [Leptospiraceae bacterium]MCP5493926.1 NfeD family protein [Leptospiraceae bacterium]
MDKMVETTETLQIIKVFWFMAISGTIAYLIKLVIGFIGGEFSIDDIELDNEDFQYFSFQTLFMLVMSIGWMGIFTIEYLTWDLLRGISISVAFGIFVACIEVYIFYKLRSLHEIHVGNTQNAIGKIGKVYLTIPENGTGEVQVSFEGSLKNMKAISENGENIKSFTDVKVIGVKDNTLIVSKVQ